MSGTLGLFAKVAVAALLAFGPAIDPAANITTTVPNGFHRTCSRITQRCTPYQQLNPPYVPGVGGVYSTTSCYCWIWS